MSRLLKLVTFLLLFGCSSKYEERKEDQELLFSVVSRTDEGASFAGVFENKKIIVKYRLRTYDAKRDSIIESWIGTDGSIPEMVFEFIQVEIGKTRIDIPKEVYSDFGEILGGGYMSLLQRGDQLVIVYSGSDGAGAYSFELIFLGDEFVRAEVYPDLYPSSDLRPIVRQ